MEHAERSFVIALDGPAASGKGTLARLLADHYGFAYLDTGSLYRGVAWVLIDRGFDPSDEEAAAAIARDFSIDQIEGAAIRTKEIGAAASIVAANPEVRAALLDYQRRFATEPPGPGSQPPEARRKNRARGGARGAVLDGRDIGTVVCPDAPMKFFVTASPEVRAHRRWKELLSTRPDVKEADILADLRERDARDAERKDAPMVAAEDAELLDTTDLSIDAAFAAARRVIDGVFKRWGEQ
ncbi:MAG: d(CMP) kinase [Pseudomonadota bacterium]